MAKHQHINTSTHQHISKAGILISLLLLSCVYVLQHFDYLNTFLSLFGTSPATPVTTFIINKTFRLILNDFLCFGLIYSLFGERKYIRIAFFVFCFELFIILPVYFVFKLALEGTSEISSPLLSQIHRLVVNPMLMLILIIGFYFQRSGLFNKA
jgi:exosortase F-associated protein